MAKISQYPDGSSPQDNDLFIVARSGRNYRLLWSALKAAIKTASDLLYQPLDSDLTAIAALSPSNDDIIQRKSGAWTNRTMAQLATDLTTLAPLASPTFTGNPTAPTPTAGDNDTSIATTAFVQTNMINGWYPSSVQPTRTASDDPTYTIQFASIDLTGLVQESCPVKWTQNSIVRYGFVSSAPTYGSGNTTMTILTRLDGSSANYDVLDTSTYPITGFSFAPPLQPGFGFPSTPDKWTTTYTSASDASTATSGAWTNVGSNAITVPIGSWELSYKCRLYCTISAASLAAARITLSTANNSASDADFTLGTAAGSITSVYSPVTVSKIVSLASKTTYYLNVISGAPGLTAVGIDGSQVGVVIRARSTYL